MEQRTRVCWKLAHQTVFGAPGPYNFKQATLGKSEARTAIIHRTVWWATGATAPGAPTALCKSNSDEQCRAKVRAPKSEVTGLSGVAPDCPVQQDDKAPQRSTDPNDCADVARIGQCTWLSGGVPDCPVRPSPAEINQWLEVEMAMGKYPPGITTPYPYPRHKNNPTGSPIYTGGYEFTPIPILMWVWVTHRVTRTHKN
jgi:hypothetical protein